MCVHNINVLKRQANKHHWTKWRYAYWLAVGSRPNVTVVLCTMLISICLRQSDYEKETTEKTVVLKIDTHELNTHIHIMCTYIGARIQ